MFKIFAIWRLGLFLLGIWGSVLFQNIPNGVIMPQGQYENFDYIKSLLQWDGGHYSNIAKFGYQITSDFAFFPLYPLLIKSLSAFMGDEIFWGLFVSNVSFFVFLLLLFKTSSKKYSKKIAFNVFATYLFFPTTFFTTAFYSESLLLLMALASIYTIDNKKYLLSAIFISLSSLTRMVGSLLIVSFFYIILAKNFGIHNEDEGKDDTYFDSRRLRTKGFQQSDVNLKRQNSRLKAREVYKYLSSNPGRIHLDRKIIYPILSASGIMIYSFYLFMSAGNPLQFSAVQTLWGREVVDPISTILFYIWTFLYEFKNPIDYLDLLLTVSFLVILCLGIRKISPPLWIFSTLAILIPVSSGTLTSMPRYALASIGAFIIIGIYLEDKPLLKIPFWTISLILQIILYVRFLNGFWVA